MPQLIHQRCQNHYQREAVARCPECAAYFCRECISEHEERVICAGCLRKIALPPPKKKLGLAWLARFIACCLGLMLAWLFFYMVGECLLALPDSFHAGTMWQGSGSEK